MGRGDREVARVRGGPFEDGICLQSSLVTAFEQGRRRPESAVRAYLTVIDRNPEAGEKALMNEPSRSLFNLPKKFTRS